MNLAKKNLKLKVDNRIFIKIIKPNEVTKSYVQWLKDYEVTKYTDQNKYSHSLASTKSYVSQKFNSENDRPILTETIADGFSHIISQ